MRNVLNWVLTNIEGILICAIFIPFCIWFMNVCTYRTLIVREVDYTTDEVVVEYNNNLYAAYVDHDLLDDYEEQGSALVQMKSLTCWDFELCPELDEVLDIRL